jgi:hypothetical protein
VRIMSSGKTIGELIDNKHTIFGGAGIKEKKGSPDAFPFLLGLPLIGNADVREFYTPVTSANHRLTKKDIYLESGRTANLFEGEHILLKAQTEKESDIVVSYVNQSAVFKHDIFGISSSKDPFYLKLLYCYFISDLHTYFQFLTTCSWGIATRPAIRQHEYLSFPYLEMEKGDQQEIVGLAGSLLDALRDKGKDFMSSPQPARPVFVPTINDRINQIYAITDTEKDLIDYAMQISRYQFQESKQELVLRKVNRDQGLLQRYCDVFFSEMEGIYEGEYLQADVYPLDYFIAIHFKLVAERPGPEGRINILYDITDESQVLSILSGNLSVWNLTDSRDSTQNIFIQKDIKGYEKDSFYIIKPNEFKCWHPAMAWYDIAEIKSTIENAEIELLNESK